MVNFYNRLTADQVIALYTLIKLLKRLRIIGSLKCKTVPANSPVDILGNYDVIDMTTAIYAVEKISYDPSKESQDAEELFERTFGRISRSLRGVD